MTDQELHGAARQALNMARTDWELNGWKTSIVLASYHVTDVPPLHRMRMIERMLQEKLGKKWLDDEQKKTHGFYVLQLRAAGGARRRGEGRAGSVVLQPVRLRRADENVRRQDRQGRAGGGRHVPRVTERSEGEEREWTKS